MNKHYQTIKEQYIYWLDTLGYSKRSIYGFSTYIRDFFNWLTARNIHHIKHLQNSHTAQYYEYLQSRENKRRKQKGLSNSHINNHFIAIDRLIEFLHQNAMPTRLIPTNYRLYIDQHARINNIQPLTQAEIKQLQDCIKDSFLHLNYKQRQIKQAQLKLVFVLYYACGLRRTEGYNLTIQDIDFDHKTLFIRQGKNYKDRIIPMNKNVYKSLQDYIYNHRNQIKTNHNRLFINNTNTLLKHLKHLQSVCPIQSIKDKTITLHLLRHSIATHLLQNGMSIENISRFLGHTSLSTTQIYTHIANK